MRTTYEGFTSIKFWMLLIIEVGLPCRVNKKVLGRRTLRASTLFLLHGAVLLMVKEETFWIELGTGVLLYLLS
jgi:hypothetical protein